MPERSDRSLDVAVAMLTLVPGGMGGSETYARALTRGLATSTRVRADTFVASIGAGFSPGLSEHVVEGVRGGSSTTDRLRTLAQAQMHRGPVLRSWNERDVVHFPFTAPVPWPKRGPAMVTSIHDVQHVDLPHLFSPAERLYRRRFYDKAARDADLVMTISAFAKQSIIDGLGIDPDRIAVAPHGVDAEAFVPNFGPRGRFLLYPARGWAHKNHARLIEAVRLLRVDQPDLKLVLTGGGLETLGPLPEWVQVRGLVSAAELRELYRTAAALVFPSLYEGFGFPPLEAMASGCPVAASDAGALPEICGDAAVLFDAKDPEVIARGVRAALEDSAALTARGLARARQFTWARCVAQHEEAYQAAYERRA